MKCPRCGGAIIGRGEDASCISCGYEPDGGPRFSLVGTSEELGKEAALKVGELIRAIRSKMQDIADLQREAVRFRQIAEFCGVEVPADAVKLLDGVEAKAQRDGKRRTFQPADCRYCGLTLKSGGAKGRHELACPSKP